MDLPLEVMKGGLLIGISKFTANEEIERAAEILSFAINLTRKAMHHKG